MLVRLLQAQLDDDDAQCPKAKCVKVRKDYDTLAAENERLHKNVVDLSSFAEENRQQSQTIVRLRKMMRDLNGQLTVAKLQVLYLEHACVIIIILVKFHSVCVMQLCKLYLKAIELNELINLIN